MRIESKHPISLLVKIASVSKSGYYKYKRKPIKMTPILNVLILDIYLKSSKRKGYRAITYTLKYKYNLTVNHKKVLRIMRELKIQSLLTKKKKRIRVTTTIKENILNRNFKSDVPFQKFVTDITYIPTRHQMVYLCTAIDLYNNEPIAWTISDKQDKMLSINTIKKLSACCDLNKAIIHSDQGVHYRSLEYIKLLENLSVKQSMSRKGNCWDNACAESFFGHYKNETLHLIKHKLQNLQDVKEMTEEYINYYINDRPQKKLGGVPPSFYRTNQNLKKFQK
jgi:transposase InsO family protein